MKYKNIALVAVLFLGLVAPARAQVNPPVTATEATTKADSELQARAGEWVASLKLEDTGKAARVQQAIFQHLRSVRTWHN
jgi:hypothetical protein